MLKYFTVILLFAFSLPTQAEIINYVTPDQEDLETISGSAIKTIVIEDDFMADLDKTAAEHGDDHAMGTLANSCLKKQDYACAYKWAGVALRGFYWKQADAVDKIESIKNSAAENLSQEQIAELDEIIRNFQPK